MSCAVTARLYPDRFGAEARDDDQEALAAAFDPLLPPLVPPVLPLVPPLPLLEPLPPPLPPPLPVEPLDDDALDELLLELPSALDLLSLLAVDAPPASADFSGFVDE